MGYGCSDTSLNRKYGQTLTHFLSDVREGTEKMAALDLPHDPPIGM